jgi:alcohol dehydrogenase class IV
MVKPFQFARLPLIYFGEGKISELPVLVKRYGTASLLVTGMNSFLSSLYGENLLNKFSDSGIRQEHIIVSSEPSPEMIDNAVSRFSKFKPDVVIAIGGGSVMDAGKAISAMLPLSAPVTDFLEGVGIKEHPGIKVPFIALPTTSGTGSEATKNAVISRTGKTGFKRSLRHDNFVPDIAIVDPELTLGCPPNITAAAGLDSFTQLTEAYLSDKSNHYTDALAIEGFKAVKSSLEQSYRDGHDIEARAGMSFAALTSGICLANAGLGVIHGFASSIGGMYDIPHGVICGTLMASSNAKNVRELRKLPNNIFLKKYATLGKIFLDDDGKSDDYYIDGFVQYLQMLTDDFHLPGLRKYGLKEPDIEEICKITGNKNNPVKLSTDDLIEIINSRL